LRKSCKRQWRQHDDSISKELAMNWLTEEGQWAKQDVHLWGDERDMRHGITSW
jgi:hypothetical protein